MKQLTGGIVNDKISEAFKEFYSSAHADTEKFKTLCKTVGVNIECLSFVLHSLTSEPAEPVCLFHYGLQIGFILYQLAEKGEEGIKELEKIYNASNSAAPDQTGN